MKAAAILMVLVFACPVLAEGKPKTRKAMVVQVDQGTTVVGGPSAAAPPADPKIPRKRRFKLYKTANIWTFLRIDTVRGRVMQCQFTVKEGGGSGCVEIPPTAAAQNELKEALPLVENIGRF